MGLKATACGTLCLTALSLCLYLAAGCGSTIPPPAPGKSPGSFSHQGRRPYDVNSAALEEYTAKKKKGKARTKPKAK
jgi:hypothetical protein